MAAAFPPAPPAARKSASLTVDRPPPPRARAQIPQLSRAQTMIYKVVTFLAMLAVTAGVPTLDRRIAKLQAKMDEQVQLADVNEDVAGEVVAKYTKGKYASCAEVMEDGLCGAKMAKVGCKATCADVEAQGADVICVDCDTTGNKGKDKNPTHVAPKCEGWCKGHKQPWPVKCGWVTHACAACAECHKGSSAVPSDAS